MKKTLLALTALVAVAAPVALAAAPAEAAGNTCTRSEFRQIHRGDSITKVTRLCGKGSQTDYFGATPFTHAAQSREYNAPGQYSFVSVDFEKRGGVWKVMSKWAYWG